MRQRTGRWLRTRQRSGRRSHTPIAKCTHILKVRATGGGKQVCWSLHTRRRVPESWHELVLVALLTGCFLHTCTHRERSAAERTHTRAFSATPTIRRRCPEPSRTAHCCTLGHFCECLHAFCVCVRARLDSCACMLLDVSSGFVCARLCLTTIACGHWRTGLRVRVCCMQTEAMALWSYSATHGDELSFGEGDVLHVHGPAMEASW